MRRTAGAVLMLGAVLVQVTLAPRLEIAGAFPNLVLLVVVALTWTRGATAALVWSCAGGALLDLASPGPIGPHAIALLVGVYITGFWVRNLERATPIHVMLTTAISTVLYSVVLVFVAETLGLSVPQISVVAQLALAAAIYNSLLIPFALMALGRLQSLTPPPAADTA